MTDNPNIYHIWHAEVSLFEKSMPRSIIHNVQYGLEAVAWISNDGTPA